MTPLEYRLKCRSNQLEEQHSSGIAAGYAQCNLVVLESKYQADFIDFCRQNPKPCPLLDVLAPGQYKSVLHPQKSKEDDNSNRSSSFPLLNDSNLSLRYENDLRTDISAYYIFKDGKFAYEKQSVEEEWTKDMVGFLLGCSFSFEAALLDAGIPLRHIEENRNVSMFKTNIDCNSVGIFQGKMVVSMRPFLPEMIEKVVEITGRYPRVHGAPIQIGNPEEIGVLDISNPDYGDSVTIREGEIPVFWACGVTPQNIILEAKPKIAITHKPGCMYISDIKNEDLATVESDI